ncbi:MAG: hypothetical protein AAF515_18475 [Pseudomonadota bacterium]
MNRDQLDQIIGQIDQFAEISDCKKRYAAIMEWFNALPVQVQEQARQLMQDESVRIARQAESEAERSFRVAV